jgi:hypothetical protein
VFFGSVLTIHSLPHVLALTPQGWRLASGPQGTVQALGTTRWKTIEDASRDLVLETELALQRARIGPGITVGEA